MRVALLALMAFGSTARANDVEVSKEHFRRGVKLVELGKHSDAIKEFELAYQANPRPNLLYNIAHEHQVLAEAGAIDQMRQSVDSYERYLKMAPGAFNRREVEGYVVDLKARIESAEAAAQDTKVQPLAGLPEKAPVGDAPRSNELPARASAPATSDAAPKKTRTWIWATIGVASVLVVGGAIGLGVGLSQPNAPPSTSLGGLGDHFQ